MSMTLSETGGGMSLAEMRTGSARTETGRFDPDAFHAMERRDNALVADDILRGAMSSAFTYSFNISGKMVQGVSVVGARHIASKYGALKHRIVASMEKRGARITCQSYPFEKTPMSMHVSFLPEIADEMDFYKVVVEITDLKTGYSLQVEKSENRFEVRQDGSFYERPNFAIIAQSKAFRNAVLDIVPQDLVLTFKAECIKLGKDFSITGDIIDEKRRAVIAYAARVAIPVDRAAVALLTFDQINGLAEATREIAEAQKAAATAEARDECKARFVGALSALGLASMTLTAETEQTKKQDTPENSMATGKATAGPSPRKTRAAKETQTERKESAGDEAGGDGRPTPPEEGELITTSTVETGNKTAPNQTEPHDVGPSTTATQVASASARTTPPLAMDAGSSDFFGAME